MNDLISKLSEIRSQYNCLDEADEPYYRALSEAIKKLSERVDRDTISRKLAIDTISNMFAPTPSQKDMVEDCLEIIDNLPPAQPKSGQWVKHDTYYDCSRCSCIAPCTETADSIIWKLSDFCPDCGARMQNTGRIIEMLSAQPEQHEIGYSECANAMLKMWIDNVLTDGEYSRIMDKLNAHWGERWKE